MLARERHLREVEAIGGEQREWELGIQAPVVELAEAGEVGVVLGAEVGEGALDAAQGGVRGGDRGEEVALGQAAGELRARGGLCGGHGGRACGGDRRGSAAVGRDAPRQ